MPDKGSPLYVFGDFTLDVRRASLLRAGEPVSLRPKAFDALRYLVEHAGELSTKDELVNALWPRSVVTDDSLVKCIQDVRQALGDDEHRCVKTVPRRGYIFDERVEVDASDGADVAHPSPAPLRGQASPGLQPPPRDRGGADGEFGARRAGRERYARAALAASIVVVGLVVAYALYDRAVDPPQVVPSIAVLPFLNLSSDTEQEYFSDGLAEELLNKLAKLDGLRVAARTSSFVFKGSNESVQSIAAKLGVENVLEGSVRTAGDEIRVTAQLIESEGGTHLWSETYERELDDIFSIQEEIAQSVAAALSVTLGIGDREKLRSGTRNVEAFNHYLSGLAPLNEFGRDSTANAIERIARATEIDPEYADAWSVLSLAHVQHAYWVTGDFEVAEIRAEQAARRALELNPDMAAAHSALANVHLFRKDWAAAERELSTAVSIPSDFVATWDYAVFLEAAGYLDEALEYRRRTRQALPLNVAPAVDLATTYHALGDLASAEKELAEAASLVGDRFVLDDARARFAMARRDEDALRQQLGGLSNSQDPMVELIASILDSPERGAATRRRLREALSGGPRRQRALAPWAAYFGEPELAIELQRERMLAGPLGAARLWDPVMREARGTQVFKDLVRGLGLVDFWRARGWPTLCRPVGADDFECD